MLLAGVIFATPGAHISGKTGLVIPLDPALQAGPANEIQDFSPLSSSSGWILLDSRLYLTRDNGGNWQDLTPPLPAAARLLAVTFLDDQSAWVLWTEPDPGGGLALQVSSTVDAGLTWERRLIQNLGPEDADISIESASMDWLNPSTGWVSLKRQTGTNFSAGALFHTEDGGLGWVRSEPPAGEPVHFVDARVGWMAGGPAKDQLFKSENAGLTWAEQSLPQDLQTGQPFTLFAPVFDPAGDGLLAALVSERDHVEVNFYTTPDGGSQWTASTSLALDSQNGVIPLFLLDPQNAVLPVPNSNRILHVSGDGHQNSLTNEDALSANITDLRMLSPDLGWARWDTSTCTKQASARSIGTTDINCTASTKLIRTMNAGITWEALVLPEVGAKMLVQSSSASSSVQSAVSAASAANTQVLIGKGFDICGAPTTAQLDIWDDFSPYTAVNLYIGGSMLYDGCLRSYLDAAYVVQARAIGWTFIPTWVGPQAPCTSYKYKISSNTQDAYNEGVLEANLAIDKLALLGLTTADKKGSIVYYDLETFVGDQACRDAVKSFLNGWDYRLKMSGNLSGIYGSTGCTNGLNNYINLPNPPDAMWAALWDYHDTLWNIGCIPNSAWDNHERIHQYTGGVNEKWGGVTLNLDNNIIDGIVAIPNQATVPPPPSAQFSAVPVSGASPFEVTFYILNTANIATCSWDYGDGSIGNSCASWHKHTYSSGGSYSVTLTVNGPGGWDDLTRSNYISVTEVAALPDLVPYPHGSRANPVIISSSASTTVNDTLMTGQPIYIDWGYKNIASAAATTGFKVDLYIDSQRVIDSVIPGLGSLTAGGQDDFSMTWDVQGWHTVRLVVDPDNAVVESNETNNTWTGQFYWEPAPSAWPNIIAPTGIILTGSPSFMWSALPPGQALSYKLELKSLTPGGIGFSYPGIPVDRCTASVCTLRSNSPLPAGDYQFRVGVTTPSGTSFTPWQVFTVSGLPAAPTIVAPAGTLSNPAPTFSWVQAAGASWYELHVYPAGASTPIISQTSIQAGSSCTSTNCSWTAADLLTRGDYQFELRAANLSGASPFSQGSFSVDADVSTIYLPLVLH